MKNTGVRIGIIWMAIAAVLLAVWLGGAVMAQREGPGPGRPGPMPPMQGPPIIMKAGSGGVFVLMGNVLTRYDAALAQKGSVKLAVQNDGQDPQRPMPPMPVIMLLSPGAHEKVLVLIGDQFFSVDSKSLAIVTAKLPPLPMMQPPPGDNPNPPDNGGAGQMGPGGPGRSPMGMAPMGMPMPGGLELQGNVLYMLRGPRIVGININDGSIVGPVPLPMPHMPG